jgi:hypothetical protein
MSKTMAEVLAEHAFHLITPVDLDEVNGPWQVECNCTADPIKGPSFLGAEAAFATHQQDILTAAGFGLVADAKREASERVGKRYAELHQLIRDELRAQAWDEGYATGNAHNGRRDANPYRAAAVRGEG